MIVKQYLRPLKLRQIDTLILGCTHYPVLADLIQEKAGHRIRLVDSALAVADQLKYHLKSTPDLVATLSRKGRCTYYISDVTPQFESIARKVTGQRLKVLPAEP
jgi:glutamate racemase